MKAHIILASAATLALAACGGSESTTANEAVADNAVLDTADNMVDDNMVGGNMMAPPAATAANGQEYATMAAAGDLYEIESSRLALEKAQNAQVKELAQMIITDHEKSTADLKTAAGEAQPAITVTPALNAEQQANMEALRAASAADFDRLYISQQIPAHEKTLALVQDYAGKGEVVSLKAHAATVTAPVQRHLERLRTMQQ